MIRLDSFVFWFSFAAVAYVYAGYPLCLALISKFFPRKSADTSYLPSVSFLISAYNEEAGIRRKLEQTVALDYPRALMEIIVLSDGSTDQTDSIVEAFGDPRVRLIRVGGRHGKTYMQNAGVREAHGEIIVFSDATTIYHPTAIRYLVASYADPAVGAVSGHYKYFDPSDRSPTGMGTIAFWNYENSIKLAQSRIATITGCCGCIYSVRKEIYTPLPEDLISDLVQPLRVICKGSRVIFESRALAYEETTSSTVEEFTMRVRVVTRGMRGLLSTREVLLPWRFPWVAFQLWSHKVLRWLVPFFLLGLLGSSALLWRRFPYGYFFLAQTAFYVLALFSLFIPVSTRWKPLGIPLYFCTLNAAALCSLADLLRGKTYKTWQTIRT